MKPAPFDYAAPATVDEAAGLLAEHGDEAKVLAGGQSLVPVLALRLARPSVLIDVNRVDGLAGVRRDNGTMRVGALTRHAAVERDPGLARAVPLLTRAAPLIGHFQIRNRGTVGGSLAHADPAAEWPAVALALDAELEVRSGGGTRVIGAGDFFVSTFMTALEPDDLLVAARFPVWGPGSGFAVEELARRSGDFAIAGVVCGVQVAGVRVTRAAIALLGMGSTPLRAGVAERHLAGASPDDLDLDELGRLAVADLEPPGDIHASSGYRRRVGAALVSRALARALDEAQRKGRRG
ncbi:MAG TPA: xanthine dehydrogenase family protein subunit M [Streptosporangiaceae bacterium]|nr:xanthine dehydrogenase family protein subunit M [Streptosporangiaceae bacterium]